MLDLRIVGKNFAVLKDIVDQVMEIGKETQGVVFRYTDLALQKPQIEVRIDQQRASHLGFQVKDVADAVEAAIGGQKTISKYDVEGRYFYIRVMEEERDFSVRSGRGEDHTHLLTETPEPRFR